MTNQKKNLFRVLAAVLALVLVAACGIAVSTSAAAAGTRSPAATAEPPAGDGDSVIPEKDDRPVVRVGSVDELLAAIASDTVIELEEGTYCLTEAKNYGRESGNPNCFWNEAYDGWELEILNIKNLALRGAGIGKTVISTDPRYANVLYFCGCKDIDISGLTVGHTQEPGFCAGGVLYFNGCTSVSVDACGLYGCGTIGVWGQDCSGLTVTASDIYECSYSAVTVYSCRNVRVEDCDVYSHGTRKGQDSAFNLFDASYSDGFLVYRNRIHDSNAQHLLNLDYTRGAVFLSNEVSDNRIDSSVFCFRQYGATVDGCLFSGQRGAGGWYEETGVFASDAEGTLLNGAALESMTLRDLDPADIAPASTMISPAEVPAGGEIRVKTVDELLAAIGPDRTIVLDGSLFDLSSASGYGSVAGEYWFWQESYDGPTLVIQDIYGLTIEAAGNNPKECLISAVPRYADVLSFRSCSDIRLIGFTAGHTEEPGLCSGGVLSFQNCNGIVVDDCRLYGCGILGVQCSNCTSFSAKGTEIYECSQGAVNMYMTDDVRFVDCDIHDVPSPAFCFIDCGDKSWNGEPMIGDCYDVSEDGNLFEFSYEFGEEYVYIPSAVLDNPFAYEEPAAFDRSGAAFAFAAAVQQMISQGDWDAFAGKLCYPLPIFGEYGTFSVASRADFLSADPDSFLTEDFRLRVADASLATYGYSLFGNTFCDGYLAFVCIGDPENVMDYRLSCISPVAPLF